MPDSQPPLQAGEAAGDGNERVSDDAARAQANETAAHAQANEGERADGPNDDAEADAGALASAVDSSWVIGVVRRLLPADASNTYANADDGGAEPPASSHRPRAEGDEEEEEGPDKDRIEAACVLWDLCVSHEQSLFLARNRIFDVIASIFSAPPETYGERLLEVCAGILGNMALAPEVAAMLAGGEGGPLASAALELFLACGDARTLAELCRFLAVLTSAPASRDHWVALFDEEEPAGRVLWIAENALHCELLERDLGLLLNLLFYGAGRPSLAPRLVAAGALPVLVDLATAQCGPQFSAAVSDALLRVLEVVTSEGRLLLPALLRARRGDEFAAVQLQRALARLATERAEDAPDTAGAACGLLHALEEAREEGAPPALLPLADAIAHAPGAICDLLGSTDGQNLPGVLACLHALGRAGGPPLDALAARVEGLEAALRRAWAAGPSEASRFEEAPGAGEELRSLCVATANLLATRLRAAGHAAAAGVLGEALREMPPGHCRPS